MSTRLKDIGESISSFGSWNEVGVKIVEAATELDLMCPPRLSTLAERRGFVYGGLIALDNIYGWDHIRKSQENEEDVLWMFTQLFVR